MFITTALSKERARWSGGSDNHTMAAAISA
jgi:hypothetical protein